MLRTRELQEQRASAVASGGATGGADGGLAEELSAARRTIASLEQTVTAEKGHAQQYRLLAEATEKERDEQAALTAELKAATDKQIEQLQTAKRVLEEEKATVLRAESARAEEAAELRRQLADAQRTAEEALAAARQAEVDKVSHVAAEAAKAQSLQLQLSAAEEASERNAAKYRTELLHHSEDMQALSKAKEAEARAIAAHEQGKELLAEATAQHLAMKVSLEERQGMLSAQLAQQDELLANALRETTLLHAQLQAATAASASGGRRVAEAAEAAVGGGAGADGEGGSAAAGAGTELLALLERDKRVLSQRAEVLTLEVTRLKQSLESVTRQHALSQAALAEYQRTQPQAAAAAAHDDAMATARELNLLRDSNAMMRSREEAKEAQARAATEALAALQAQVEPTQQKLVAAESARAALVAQLEQERAACQTWQRRNSELLDKTATSVGQEAYKELDRAKEEMQKQLEGARAEADAAKAAKDSAEKELEEMKKTEKKLRGTGAKFRDDAAAANKLLDEERAAKAQLEEELTAARDAGAGAGTSAALSAAKEDAARLTEANNALEARVAELTAAAEENATKYTANMRRALDARKKVIQERDDLLEALKAAGAGASPGAQGEATPEATPLSLIHISEPTRPY